MFDRKHIVKVKDYLYEIPKEYRYDMRVPARIYTSGDMLRHITEDRSLEQLVNVSALPGIVGYALAMPDVHEGYGFPVGGVAAFDVKEGIISPGGIGYDINCGIRLLRSEMSFENVKPHLQELGRTIFSEVPSGVGRSGRLPLTESELDELLKGGAQRMVSMGYGREEDLKHIESGGALADAEPKCVSEHAKKRGHDQLGTMGAGNHFVEVGYVETIFDKDEAAKMGLAEQMVTILVHTGSRGLGHQVATDYIKLMMKGLSRYHLELPDRELSCAPFASEEGQQYFRAMSASANFAWANRQMITWEVRKAWGRIFGEEELHVVYDVAHNIAKVEEYELGANTRIGTNETNKRAKKTKLVVHRKGATRAFPGQPVLIPGSMGTASYVLVGTEASLKESFGSSAHGAGRRMSRTKARKEVNAKELRRSLLEKGIVINAGSESGLAEEAPLAYKDIDEVVNVINTAGIAKKVVRLRPIAVVKG